MIPFHKAIKDAIENYEDGYDLSSLFTLCETAERSDKNTSLLWSLHHTCYDTSSFSVQLNGQILSSSLLTFVMAATSEKLPDTDLRTIKDFPLVVMHTKWVHDLFLQVPILRLSQQVVVDTLLGLDWFMTGDMFTYYHERTTEEMKQCRDLFRLLRIRIFYFIQSTSLSTNILDMEEYSKVEKAGILKKVDTSEVDYASDDETFNKRVHMLEEDFSENDIEVAYVNSKFIYDMDALITYHQQEWFRYDNTVVVDSPIPFRELSVFRSKIFELITTIDDKKDIVRQRSLWQESLQITPAHIRIFKRSYGITNQPTVRQVMVVKNDVLPDIGQCNNFEDIVTRRVTPDKVIMLRLATDSLFHTWSLQHNGETAAVLNKYIIRDKMRNIWTVKLGDDIVRANSFTHAFFLLRDYMGDEPIIDDKHLDVYDALFRI